MCILRFHARAGYLQHYETLLKELNEHPASDPVPDQYEVECAALSDRNLNVPCESGLRFPSYMVMLQRRQTQSRISVNFCLVHVHTVLYCVCTCSHMIHTCMYMYMHLTQCAWQAKSKQSTGCVSLDINLLKQSRIFSSRPELSLQGTLHPLYPFQMDLFPIQSGWITYTGRQILSCVGCQPNWQSGLVRTCRMSWDFLTKLIRGQSLALVGPLQS